MNYKRIMCAIPALSLALACTMPAIAADDVVTQALAASSEQVAEQPSESVPSETALPEKDTIVQELAASSEQTEQATQTEQIAEPVVVYAAEQKAAANTGDYQFHVTTDGGMYTIYSNTPNIYWEDISGSSIQLDSAFLPIAKKWLILDGEKNPVSGEFTYTVEPRLNESGGLESVCVTATSETLAEPLIVSYTPVYFQHREESTSSGTENNNSTAGAESSSQQTVVLKPTESVGTQATETPAANSNTQASTSGTTASQGSTADSSPSASQQTVANKNQTVTISSVTAAAAASNTSSDGKIIIRKPVIGVATTKVGNDDKTDSVLTSAVREQAAIGKSWVVPESTSAEGLSVSDPFTTSIADEIPGMSTGTMSSSGFSSFLMQHALGVELGVIVLFILGFAILIIPDIHVLEWLKKRRLENLWKNL